MLCSEWSLVHYQSGFSDVVTLHCNSWGCPICRPRRKRRLVMQAKAGKPNTFLTLTVNPAIGLSPVHRAKMLARAFRLVRLRAMRRYGYRRLPFICVFEQTKEGEPHLHALMRCKWIDQRWLSKQMDELIGAPVVDIRRVTSARGIANYVAKYIGKAPHRFGTTKRYWQSQDYAQWRPDHREEPEVFPMGWHVIRQDVKSYVAMMERNGGTPVLRRGGYRIWHGPEPGT